MVFFKDLHVCAVVWGVGRGMLVKVRGQPWLSVLETGSLLGFCTRLTDLELVGIFPLLPIIFALGALGLQTCTAASTFTCVLPRLYTSSYLSIVSETGRLVVSKMSFMVFLSFSLVGLSKY